MSIKDAMQELVDPKPSCSASNKELVDYMRRNALRLVSCHKAGLKEGRNMALGEYSDEELLFEIAKREFNREGKFSPAPIKTVRTSDHHEILIGVGNDHTAGVVFDQDTWRELRERNSSLVAT